MSITQKEKICLIDDVKIMARLIKAALEEEDKSKRAYLGIIIEDVGNHLIRDVSDIKVEE